MPLDINLLRAEKGGHPEMVRESIRRRFKDPAIVDEIIRLDVEWRQLDFQLNQKQKDLRERSISIGQKKKVNQDTTQDQEDVKKLKEEIEQLKKDKDSLRETIDAKLSTIGNLVADDVPVSIDEAENRVIRLWGQPQRKGDEKHHHELLHMIDGYDAPRGVVVAGHRGYFLKGPGVLLNQALIRYGLDFLMKRNYVPLQPPFFMNKAVMAETAQLEQFDEELYKVIASDDEKYLIATSEQPISAFHRHETLTEEQLPLRYAGISSCFRKEAGSHGKDTWGIFRIHQFEKVEQFVVCAPSESWRMHEEMLHAAEEFIQSLEIPYRVISIVSGALNNAAAKKYDIEAWFPTLAEFRELVSCSNCTDYQARAMETRFGHSRNKQQEKTYVHMLNATLCATERTICCLLENYQTPEGVVVPKVLQPYMNGATLLPYVKEAPVDPNAVREKKTQKKQRLKEGQKVHDGQDQ